MPQKLQPYIVKEWLNLVSGKFSTHDIWQELGIVSPEGKSYLRVILHRLEAEGLISSMGTGNYRKVDKDIKVVKWQEADPNKTIPLKFPFGEHEFAKIYPKSIIILAGSKNAGKTAYLYNFIALNMNSFVIDLYNSETSPEQMHERFRPLDIPVPPPFNTYERYDNFADVIQPEHISVIDYLDLNSEVYLVGAEIDNIFRKLTTGCAIIGLQKPPPVSVIIKGVKKIIERDLAYGGGFSAKRAVLYISMGSNKLKLLYVKTPKQPRMNPNNMSFSFSLNGDGVHFINIQRSYGEDL